MLLMLRQIWALTIKNLLIAFVRRPASTTFRAFLLPVVFVAFLSYARNLFIPASVYGISNPYEVRSLPQAISDVTGGRNKLVFVNSGFQGGDIGKVISRVTEPLQNVEVLQLEQEAQLREECRNTILGTSTCIAAAVFYSSPTEGQGGIWNYSLRADGALNRKIVTDADSNDQQVYILPLQHAIDIAISEEDSGAAVIGAVVNNYPYTSITREQRAKDIRTRYMEGVVNILGVAFYIGMVGVSYQLTGLVAKEREIGMAQLLDSMMPNKARWQPQAVRIIANHLSFDILYLPGWIIMSVILFIGTFAESSPAIMLIYNILAGLATASFSIFAAGFFKKAQLSGILTVISFMLLAVVAQIINKSGTATYAILSLLFPPCNYVMFVITLARWERQELGMNLIKAAPQHTSSLPGIAFWIFSIIQILVYPVLGAILERVLYGTASKSRKTEISNADAAIFIEGFTKTYSPRWATRLASAVFRRPLKTVNAVDNLNLVAQRGEIMVYLGANGSGKSTTLDAIAGLTEITSGTIVVSFADENTSLGLCPQKNVLWDDLTVVEHVRIFNKVKCGRGVSPASKADCLSLLESCDIAFKAKARSTTLSGGQKRKLQLAMMFTGGSTVCCVDEVSSGLDPLSRRKIWDILLAERGKRSILLTTHFLDEADLLADHIAILSRGKLTAFGTSVELKSTMGEGYRVHVYHREDSRQHVTYNAPHVVLGDQTEYLIATSTEATEFIQQLEMDGVTDYQISGPTIEDVFLKVAREAQLETIDDEKRLESEKSVNRSPSPESRVKSAAALSQPVKQDNVGNVPELLTGKRISMFKQSMVLFRKRLIVARRNPLPLLAALLIPIIAAGLVSLFIGDYELPSCNPLNIGDVSDIISLSSQFNVNYQLVAGPTASLTPEVLQRFAATLPGSSGGGASNTSRLLNSLRLVDTLPEFNEAISTRFANITPGGFFLGSGSDRATIAWKGNGQRLNAQIMLNMLDNVLSEVPIATQYQAFDVPFPADAGAALQMITYFGLALSIAPAFFALYPTLERLRFVRSLHYSNGVRALPLWLAYCTFDFIIVLLFSALTTIIFATVSSAWYHVGYLFVVLFLYGLASILLSYVVSLFSRSQLAAWSIAAAGQCIFFLIFFIAFMSILTYVDAASQGRIINLAYFVIAAFSPIANVQRALFVALNVFNTTCNNRQLASYPGAITMYGGPILYLILQSLILFGILLWWDSGSLYQRLRQKKSQAELEERNPVDADVSKELIKVASAREGLRVLHLSKQFKKNLAVDDVTFGVPRGEVFALLGPNGAGKSTCISLIRGDIQPSRHGGDILVDDISVISHRAHARTRLGVCPQVDCCDTMTVYEHLDFYARIRGVSDPKHNALAVMQAVGISQYSDRMAAKLSGGNKRKLSLGIALMGNPALLLLDEPSSGMDALAKRVMWRAIERIKSGRSVVITTHSMEEASALADKAGIMASRLLTVGTTRELRESHGRGKYHVHLVLKPNADMQAVRAWMSENLGAELDGQILHGQMRFVVSDRAVVTEKTEVIEVQSNHATSIQKFVHLMKTLESHKDELGIEYYSVSPTTLEDVFLAIAQKARDVQND